MGIVDLEEQDLYSLEDLVSRQWIIEGKKWSMFLGEKWTLQKSAFYLCLFYSQERDNYKHIWYSMLSFSGFSPLIHQPVSSNTFWTPWWYILGVANRLTFPKVTTQQSGAPCIESKTKAHLLLPLPLPRKFTSDWILKSYCTGRITKQ